jgi:translation initiation factor 2 beta subunit (eIF-2beta)/eIF-5
MTTMFEGLAKKKKKSSSKKDKTTDDAEAPAADAEFDPSALKKKKKKAKKAEADDFEAKLAEAGANEEAAADDDEPVVQQSTSQEGDLEKGTGIWQHSNTTPIEYPLLLTRFFSQLNHHNPDLASSGGKSYKIPPPQCLREGNKKTIFANISEICRRMKRTDEHVTQFLFSELGTSGSVAGQGQLVIKGRFQQKQLENVLRRYIGMFLSSSSFFCCIPVYLLQKKKRGVQKKLTDTKQSSTLLARPAARRIQSSTRVRTVSTSSPATRAVPDVPSLPSRPVSRPRSASAEDSKLKQRKKKKNHVLHAFFFLFSFASVFVTPKKISFPPTSFFYLNGSAMWK